MAKGRNLSASIRAITSVDQLRVAWLLLSDKKAGASRDSSGTDGISINQFAQYADEHLRLLSNRLRQPTPYDFSPLKAHLERKSSGKTRVICVPTVRDRIVQRAVLTYLAERNGGRYAFENALSYGFIRGKSVGDAVAKAKKLRNAHPWAYKTDIASFFDEIDRDILRSAIKSRIRCHSVHPLLLSAIGCEVQPENVSQAATIKQAGIRWGIGVRQGMPLSPYFSNLMLADFDQAVLSADIQMVRYADDLIFLADSENECKEIHSFCAKELAKINLRIHSLGTPNKSVIAAPNDPVEFLGVHLVPRNGEYRLELSDAQIASKKSDLLRLGNIDELVRERITLSVFLRSIDSKIMGWIDAYKHCDNAAAFNDALRDFRTTVVQRVLLEGLGIRNPNLVIRQFLEIAPLPKRVRP